MAFSSKRFFRRFGFVLLGLIVIALGVALYILPVGSAFAAKTMCSCVFVAEIPEQTVREVELQTLGVFDTEVDYEKKRVIGSFMGLRSKTVVYRPGTGCTIASDVEPDALQAQTYSEPQKILTSHSDTLHWPMGPLDTLAMPEGVDKKRLDEVIAEMFVEDHPEGNKNTRGLLVMYDGKIVGEQYAKGFDEHSLMRGWSMTKSVTNAMVGILVQQGKLDIMQPAPVPEWEGADDPRGEITMDHLLRMSSGLDFMEVYGFRTDATEMLFLDGNAGEYAANSDLGSPPDTQFSYSSGTTNILSRIVKDQFDDQQAYFNFPYEQLFNPLGMERVIMEPDASGTFVGSSFMWATLRDWTRFGMLYLNDGVWNGQRILPEGWVEYSRTPTPTAKGGVYGAQFWLPAKEEVDGWFSHWYWPDVPNDAFLAEGFEGQMVCIIPSRNVVITRLGVTHNRATWDMEQLIVDILTCLPEPGSEM